VDGKSQIAIVRDGATVNVPVATGAIQGEWVVVESSEIREGDAVVGSVTSTVNEDSQFRFGPPGGGGGVRTTTGGGPRP
jgi:hypothetical protein